MRKEGGWGMLVLRLWGRGVAELRLRTPGERGGGTSESFQLQLSSYVQVCEEDGGLNGGGIICIWVW